MTSILQKISRVLISSVLLFGASTIEALAQEAVSFSVSPTIFDMTANPGQTWKSSVRVINANPFDLAVSVEIMSFVPKGEGGTPRFIPVTAETPENSTLAQWIATNNEVTIKAEQTTELPLTITVPQDASPGGQFAAILISTKSVSNQSDNTKVETSQVISSLIFLRVSGDVNENSAIRSFRTTDYIVSKPRATFELRIENKGNVHVQPQGEIKIFNMWGQERGVIPVNQQTLFGNVLPNSFRKYSFTWEGKWAISDIGRYTAEATLVYGLDKKQFMSAETTFWLIPWKILLLIIAFLGGFFALISWAIKLYVRKMLTLAGITNPTHSTLTLNTAPVRASVTAPIEAGILDLRSRLQQSGTDGTKLAVIITFIRSYWVFFTAVASIIMFIIVVAWFIKGANTPTRDFEVNIESEGRSVEISSGTQGIVPQETPSSAEAGDAVSQIQIKMVNRSGSESAGLTVKRMLGEIGYRDSKITNDLTTLEERTVIVYTPDVSAEALVLSQRLNNAPLSVLSDAGTTTAITIYIGTDAISLQ